MTSTATETEHPDPSSGEGDDRGPGTAPADPSDRGGSSDERRAWRGALVKGAVAYVVSRVMVIAGAGIVAAQRGVDANVENVPRPEGAQTFIVQVLDSWDGNWYMEIVRGGYPRQIPADITYFQVEARAAFFPLYPMLVRAFDRVLPGSEVFAGIFVNALLGLLVVLMVGLLARELFGTVPAERTMVLMALFPGSFVLSFAYSEALLILLAAACLLLLHRRQWLLAGVVAALATATRPNGVAVAAACGVAALIAIWQDREWKALIAPVLAPLGFIAFQWYLRVHTSEDWAWFRVQREAWAEGTSFGATALQDTFGFLTHPLNSPTDVLTTTSLVAMFALLWTAWKKRLPWPMVAYVGVVLALMLIPETVTARPRFVYTAFPLFLSAGAWWPDDDERSWAHDGWTLLIALCAAGLVTLTALYGVYGAIP
ncbi:MAG: glycosyltransferase family 39 protein [Acidimicrobiales bacterium]|nr:glycosyltransferase family 39 protein [Acidimicrobiales bacterium]MCB1016437.1 glycosyltransferase family 39 protein [Acidimicrobiales bacterium]MCB9373729.1 glycosyltransferase family 39 protein [Microthrixaceae bacterium]